VRTLFVALLLTALAWPVAADASLGRWGLTPTGDPELWASPAHLSRYPPGDPVWRICPPNDACREIGDGANLVRPGETPGGTVFESDFTDADGTTTERSLVWQGRVAVVSPPGLEGRLAPGETVRPFPASWSGGWGDERSTPYLVACPGLGRTDCELLTDPTGNASYGTFHRALRAHHAGWYLYAVEARSPRDHDPYIVASPPPAGGPMTLPQPSALVALSPPIGPIAGLPPVVVIARPVDTAVPSPAVVLRGRAYRNAGRLTVGRVECLARCAVHLTISDGRRTLRRSLSVRGWAPLAIADRRRLRPGRLRVRVIVDGRELAAGRVRLRR
jgi:hypothetical protein